MERTGPAIKKAAEFIDKQVSWLKTLPKLPSVAQLAERAGVSYVTMWKVIHGLKESGELPTTKEPGLAVQGNRCKWERIRSAMEKDIIDGVYMPNALVPPVKVLSSKYGACDHTIRKALGALSDAGRLIDETNGYRIKGYTGKSIQDRVILIARGHSYGDLAENAPQRECLRILEAECHRHGVVLQTEFVYFREGAFGVTKSISSIEFEKARYGQTLGYIIWAIGMDRSILDSLRLEAQSTGKPVAIWSKSGSTRIRGRYNRMVRPFAITTFEKIGSHIGNYLLELGHRSIAYLSCSPRSYASRTIHHGLSYAMESDIVRGKVYPFLCDPGSEAAIETELAKATELIEGQLFPYGNPNRTTPRRKHRIMNQRMRVMRQMHLALRLKYLQEALKPYYRRALSEKTITAWVALDDTMAVECMNFLADKKVSVPENISVIGIGDTEDAFLHKITSYNYNYNSLMNAMLNHIFQPDVYHTGKIRFHRVEGFMVPRGSSVSVD